MTLSQLVFFLPAIGILVGLGMYRFQGRRNLLHFDIVQFYYTFVLAPIAFVWLKTNLHLFFRDSQLSPTESFALDTLFSVGYLFFFAFVVMHGLTKTFNLKNHDPLYDLFFDSEYIHLWLSHLLMFISSMTLVTALAVINLWFPLNWNFSAVVFSSIIASAFLFGFLLYVFVVTGDPKQGKNHRLTRVFKLGMGIGFSTLVFFYLLNPPTFDGRYGLFWFVFSASISSTTLAFLSYRSRRVHRGLDRVLLKFVYQGWGNNINLQRKTKSKFKQKRNHFYGK